MRGICLYSGRLHFSKIVALWYSTPPIEIGSGPSAFEIECTFTTLLPRRVWWKWCHVTFKVRAWKGIELPPRCWEMCTHGASSLQSSVGLMCEVVHAVSSPDLDHVEGPCRGVLGQQEIEKCQPALRCLSSSLFQLSHLLTAHPLPSQVFLEFLTTEAARENAMIAVVKALSFRVVMQHEVIGMCTDTKGWHTVSLDEIRANQHSTYLWEDNTKTC